MTYEATTGVDIQKRRGKKGNWSQRRTISSSRVLNKSLKGLGKQPWNSLAYQKQHKTREREKGRTFHEILWQQLKLRWIFHWRSSLLNSKSKKIAFCLSKMLALEAKTISLEEVWGLMEWKRPIWTIFQYFCLAGEEFRTDREAKNLGRPFFLSVHYVTDVFFHFLVSVIF